MVKQGGVVTSGQFLGQDGHRLLRGIFDLANLIEGTLGTKKIKAIVMVSKVAHQCLSVPSLGFPQLSPATQCLWTEIAMQDREQETM